MKGENKTLEKVQITSNKYKQNLDNRLKYIQFTPLDYAILYFFRFSMHKCSLKFKFNEMIADKVHFVSLPQGLSVSLPEVIRFR